MNYTQLELDIPFNQIKIGTRILILKPHEDAGKSGRIWHHYKDYYAVALRGKFCLCKREDLEIIDKRKEFKRGNFNYER